MGTVESNENNNSIITTGLYGYRTGDRTFLLDNSGIVNINGDNGSAFINNSLLTNCTLDGNSTIDISGTDKIFKIDSNGYISPIYFNNASYIDQNYYTGKAATSNIADNYSDSGNISNAITNLNNQIINLSNQINNLNNRIAQLENAT